MQLVHALMGLFKLALQRLSSVPWCRFLAAASLVRPGEHFWRLAVCKWQQQRQRPCNVGVATENMTSVSHLCDRE